MAKVDKDLLLHISGIQCPHWTSVALWTIGVVVMAALTIKGVRPIVTDYYDVEENTQVQIKYRTTSSDEFKLFKRPSLYLNVPLPMEYGEYDRFTDALRSNLTNGTECEQCEWMSHNSLDVWSQYGVQIFDRAKSANLTFGHFLLKLFVERLIELENDTVLSLDKLPSNRLLIYSLATVLSSTSETVKEFLKEEKKHGDITFFSIEDHDQLDQLYSMFVRFLCQFITIGPPDQIETSNKEQKKAYCFETLQNSTVVYSSTEYDFVVISLTLDGLEDSDLALTVDEGYFRYMQKPYVKFSLATESRANGDMGQIPFYMITNNELQQINIEHVWLTYSLQSSVVEKRPKLLASCYNESSYDVCQFNCRTNLLTSICDCRSPLNRLNTFNTSSNNASYCGWSHFHRCQAAYANATGDCADKCREPCVTNMYEWYVNRNAYKYGNSSSFNIRIIQPRQQTYLEFTMKVKDGTENLISQVGGVFNFYLGVSGLSIILFLIYFIDSLRRCHRVRVEQRLMKSMLENNARPSLIDLWGVRWLQMAARMASDETPTSLESILRKEVADLKLNNERLERKIDGIARRSAGAKRQSIS